MATGLSSYASYSSGNFRVSVDFTQEYDSSTGQSTIKITGVWVKSYGYYGYKYYPDGYIRVNGNYYYMDSYSGTHNAPVYDYNTWVYIRSSSGYKFTKTITVDHDENGDAELEIYVNLTFYTSNGSGGSGWGVYGTRTFSTTDEESPLSAAEVYTLTLTPATGSLITVNRTATTYVSAATGEIESGARVYSGDVLDITYTPDENCEILTGTINEEVSDINSSTPVTSTYTVAGDVTISTTARPLASDVAVGDGATIASDTTITITSYAEGYTHELYYTLLDPNGQAIDSHNLVLIADGLVSDRNSLDIVYAWKVPNFYSAMANLSEATCQVMCITYNDGEELGRSTTEFLIEITNDNGESSPTVEGVIVDTNSVTTALTKDSSVLILGMSTPECTITATAKNEATLIGLMMRSSETTFTLEVDSGLTSYTYTESFTADKWSDSGFEFSATDSRGFKTTITKEPTVIKYIAPTINAKVDRAGSTSGQMQISIEPSNYFHGSFGTDLIGTANQFKLEYRYRDSSSSTWHVDENTDVNGWTVFCGDAYTFTSTEDGGCGGVFDSTTYKTSSPIVIGEEGTFPYNLSYIFEVRISDSINTAVAQNITVRRGIPVFDWGENDFNFNVPVTMPDLTVGGKNLGDIASGLDDVKSTSAVTLDNDGKVTAIGGNEIAHPAFPTLLSAFTNDMSFISYKVLWENQNTVDENGEFVGFEATELTSADFSDSLSNYNLFLIAYRMNSDNPIHVTTVHWVTELEAVSCESTYTRGGDGTRVVRQRAFTMNRGESTISFETGIYTQTSSSTGSTIMVPLQIIGIRFPVITS